MSETLLSMTSVALVDYRKRVMGCWMGKAIGGTLGMPFEGDAGPLNLSFYTPVPTEMLPNDDLDLQVVWACVLDKMEAPQVDRHILAQAWLDHVQFPWDEYGVAIRNLRNGINAPLSGTYDNWFTDSMGAPIRSEIWACLAPGNADLAAEYAYEDGCVDHGGEGLWSEVFLSALQSQAFVESDPYRLITLALRRLPESCRTRRAVEDTITWWNTSLDWNSVRTRIIDNYGCENFTDAPMNIAFIILGWLAGNGDFSNSICIAVNCGMDTDCTGATLGALLGILNPDGIPPRWIEPIGRSLVLSSEIVGIKAPDTLDDFTDMVIDLRQRLATEPARPSALTRTLDEHRILAEIEYVDRMPTIDAVPVLASPSPLWLAGTVGNIGADEFESDIAVISYEFQLPSIGTYRVMLNTREECRVWIDGWYAFGRSGGLMAPSFHRVPADQCVDVTLTAGRHTLVAAIKRPQSLPGAEWVVGIADRKTLQWIPDAFVHLEVESELNCLGA